MKSTTGVKKATQKPKENKVKNYRFWLVLSCAGLVGLWYVAMVALFLGMGALALELTRGKSYTMYNYIFLSGTFAVLFLASILSMPFAAAIFKKLNIQKPLVSGVAFYMASVFGASFFIFLSSLISFERGSVYFFLAGSMVFAGLLYGFAIRPLKHKLSTVKFLVVAIGLALLPMITFVIWRLVVI